MATKKTTPKLSKEKRSLFSSPETSPCSSPTPPEIPEFTLKVFYKPTTNTTIYLTIPPTKTEYGFKVTFLRKCLDLPDEFKIHQTIVDHLYKDKPSEQARDLAFIQSCPPREDFESYDKQKDKFVMTIPQFICLVKVFVSNYKLWEHRMEHLKKQMKEGVTKYPLNDSMTFSGPADIYIVATIQEKSFYSLLLELMYNQEKNTQTLVLAYSKIEGSTVLTLFPSVMDKVVDKLDTLLESLGYIEASPRKKFCQ